MNKKNYKMLLLGLILTASLITTQKAFAGMYIALPKGTIHMAYVDYNDANTNAHKNSVWKTKTQL